MDKEEIMAIFKIGCRVTFREGDGQEEITCGVNGYCSYCSSQLKLLKETARGIFGKIENSDCPHNKDGGCLYIKELEKEWGVG